LESLDTSSDWTKTELKRFDTNICRFSWELNGNYLAIATADGNVFVFKEITEGKFDMISQTNSEGAIENNS
jgi:hypothetical protein